MRCCHTEHKYRSWAAQDTRVGSCAPTQPFQQCGAFEVQYLSPPPPLRLLRSAAQRRVAVQSLAARPRLRGQRHEACARRSR